MIYFYIKYYLLRKRKNIFWDVQFFSRAISLGRVVLLTPKIVLNLPRTYEENHIDSAVSEILWYKQTDRQADKHPVT